MNTNEIDNSDIIITIYERLYKSKETTPVYKSYLAFYKSLTRQDFATLTDTPLSDYCEETRDNGSIFARNMFWQMLREDKQLAHLSDRDIRVITKRYKYTRIPNDSYDDTSLKFQYDEDETNEVDAFIKEVNEEIAKCQITSE